MILLRGRKLRLGSFRALGLLLYYRDLLIDCFIIQRREPEKVYFFPSSFERSLALITAFMNAALTPASSRA